MRPGVKAVIAETERVIQELKDKRVSADELQKAKNLGQSSFIFSQDSVFAEAMQLGVYEMLGDYRMMDRYLPGTDKVTTADVRSVVKKYLVASNRTIGILEPTGVLPHERGGVSPSGGVR